MRCTSCTPGSTSRLRVSKSMRAPTAARILCRTPVVRCTEKPIRIRCSMICWICSSVAVSCIATIMFVWLLAFGFWLLAFGFWLSVAQQLIALVIYLRIQFCFPRVRRCRFGCQRLGSDLLLLDLTHDVHDALIDPF